MKEYLDVLVRIESDGATLSAPDDLARPPTPRRYRIRAETDLGSASCQGKCIMELPHALWDRTGRIFALPVRGMEFDSAAKSARGQSAKELGEALFAALFAGDARKPFEAARIEAIGRPGAGVRIRLELDLRAQGLAEVAALPWELLRLPDDDPLVVSTQTTLVRCLELDLNAPRGPFVAPLGILVLISQPTGMAPLLLDEETHKLREIWQRLDGSEPNSTRPPLVRPLFVPPVRSRILDAISELGDQCHVVHYMGHGGFDDDHGGVLYLEHEDGSPDPISANDFAVMLQDAPLRLVFLNACETAVTGSTSDLHPFAGVATALVRKRVPAVVAMQYPIVDAAAIAFSRTVYMRIAQGLPLDAAVAEGRKSLYTDGQVDWATPVLYLQAKDGALFGTARDEAPSVEAVAVAAGERREETWGAPGPDHFRVFLATPDQDRARLHAAIAKALRNIDGVRVVDHVPRHDPATHAAHVQTLISSADLSVHLLGANPGPRVDDDDPDPLQTFPLEQLRIGLQTGRPQMVLMTTEDRECVTDPLYASRVGEIENLPADAATLERVFMAKSRICDAVVAKVRGMQEARIRSVAPAATLDVIRSAFVESQPLDQMTAIALLDFLEAQNVEARMQSREASSDDSKLFDIDLRNFPLYIIVTSNVDVKWVRNRQSAALKQATRMKTPVVVGKYTAPDSGESEEDEVSGSRISFIGALGRALPKSFDDLFPRKGASGA